MDKVFVSEYYTPTTAKDVAAFIKIPVKEVIIDGTDRNLKERIETVGMETQAFGTNLGTPTEVRKYNESADVDAKDEPLLGRAPPASHISIKDSAKSPSIITLSESDEISSPVLLTTTARNSRSSRSRSRSSRKADKRPIAIRNKSRSRSRDSRDMGYRKIKYSKSRSRSRDRSDRMHGSRYRNSHSRSRERSCKRYRLSRSPNKSYSRFRRSTSRSPKRKYHLTRSRSRSRQPSRSHSQDRNKDSVLKRRYSRSRSGSSSRKRFSPYRQRRSLSHTSKRKRTKTESKPSKKTKKNLIKDKEEKERTKVKSKQVKKKESKKKLKAKSLQRNSESPSAEDRHDSENFTVSVNPKWKPLTLSSDNMQELKVYDFSSSEHGNDLRNTETPLQVEQSEHGEQLIHMLGEDLYRQFFEEENKLKMMHEREYEAYIAIPDLHHDYETYYKEFQTDIGMHQPYPDSIWQNYWKIKMKISKRNEWKEKVDKLVESFKQKIAVDQQPTSEAGQASRRLETLWSSSSDAASSSLSSCVTETSLDHDLKKQFSEKFSTECTVTLLRQISDQLGMLGPAVDALCNLIEECGDDEKVKSLFACEDNRILLDMIRDKVKNLLQSTTHSHFDMALFAKTLKWLEHWEEAKTSYSEISIDLEAIAIASRKKDHAFTVNLIKSALLHAGKLNPSRSEINDIFVQVCQMHLQMAED